MTLEEMVRDFKLDGVVKHPAIFDIAKLGWMNKEYLKAVPLPAAAARVCELLPTRMPQATRTDGAHVERVTALLLERVRTLVEIIDLGSYFFTDGPVEPTPDAIDKHAAAPETADRLRSLRAAFAARPGVSVEDVEAAIRGLAKSNGVKAAAYIHPLRVALTGQAVSPGIFEVASIIGRDICLLRIDALLAKLSGGIPIDTRVKQP